MIGGLEELEKHRKMLTFKKEDVFLSRHSLATTFERVMIYMTLGAGGSVAFFSPLMNLEGNLNSVNPTNVFLTPADLLSLHRRLTSPPEKKWGAGYSRLMASKFVVNRKIQNMRKGLPHQTVFDGILFKQARAILGNRAKGIIVGDGSSFPMGQQVFSFFIFLFIHFLLF